MTDNINHPRHYIIEDLYPYESIDIIKANLGRKGFISFCLGNVFKYLIRHEKKNGLEDLKKAKVYLNWAINSWENEDE